MIKKHKNSMLSTILVLVGVIAILKLTIEILTGLEIIDYLYWFNFI